MADRLDVAGRLAEGRPAVEHMQTYVHAGQLVGYGHPDLTAQPAQVLDWYDGEDGLDLHALDADCNRLRAACAAIAEALRLQRAQSDPLATAWTGPGADAAAAFLQRHCDTAETLVAEVGAAAQGCESLRDGLWQLIDAKVATTVAIDDRTTPQRPAWLAAAAGLTAGDARARDVVEQQIRPYVDSVVRTDWVAAMRTTRAGVAASYQTLIDRLSAAARAQFEVPGDLGQTSAPAPPIARSIPAAPAAAPAARVIPAVVPASSASLPPAAAPALPNVAVAQPDPGTMLGNAAGLPGGGGGLGGGGSGLGGGGSGLGGGAGLGALGGLASRIIQEMGGLFGSTAAPPGDDQTSPTDPDDADHKHERPKKTSHPGETVTDTKPLVTDPALPAQQSQPPPAAGPSTDPPPVAGSRLNAPPPPATPPAGLTPCEIAADELPQAGQ